MSGPLTGFKILEMAGIGPGPFCAMMLADMGAEVIRIDRLTPGFLGGGGTIIERGRRTIALDLKKPESIDIVLDLMADCNALIEGFRPGVMERLGLGPEICLKRNPKLIYGRMTGWGQSGPLATAAGHDINYLALTGALHAMGHADRPPTPPLHLLGDLGGGAMMLAFGIVCALLETQKSGQGQVIDAAICDGVSTLATGYHGMLNTGRWVNQRQANMFDGAAHFYGCYACKDGKFISLGALEPQFYQLFLALCDITDPAFDEQWNQQQWPALRKQLEHLFLLKNRDEWTTLLEGTDVCFAPVLDFVEATQHKQHVARHNFIETNGITHPAPTPKFSRTKATAGAIPTPGMHTEELLVELGKSRSDIQTLRELGVIT